MSEEFPKVFIVDEKEEGERLDKFLSLLFLDKSRTYFQKLIQEGKISVDGKIQKANYRLIQGESVQVSIPKPQPLSILPEDIPLDILYEDEDILIVNKPKGMVVHPANGHMDHTLVNAVMFHCKDSLSGINGVIRPGIVHRIDKDTTGSLIICKNDYAHQFIADQIKVHSVKRIYRGIVLGNLTDITGSVQAPIGRDPKNRKKMAINFQHGKEAITHYRVLENYRGYSYCEFQLETGRTHQIRVHMASIGHPLLGDTVYGPSKCAFNLQGQTLHAMSIGFIHPKTKAYVEFSAPLPAYFIHLLKILPK